MTSGQQSPPTLEYSDEASAGRGRVRFVDVLFALNLVAALLSLAFVPLVLHIRTCTDGEKWCQVAAVFYGAIAAGVTGLLALVSLLEVAYQDRRRSRILLPLAVPVLMLAALAWVTYMN